MNDQAKSPRHRAAGPGDSVPDRVAHLRRDMHDAGALLANGRQALADGRVPDLAPLVPRIEGMTGAIAALPIGEGRPLRPALIALLDEMTQLSRQLVETRDRLGADRRDEASRDETSPDRGES